MKKKRPNQFKKIVNRRAKYDYQLADSFVVGLQLSGAETKALRLGHGQLRGSYVNIKDGELWLINSIISPSPGVPITEVDQTRSRKLLAKRREIDKIAAGKQQGNTIVPLELLIGGRFIKLRIATGRGKKKYDKRQVIKEREHKRKILSMLKPRA